MQNEIAQFFQLALRLDLVDTVAVERWVDSIISAETTVRFPFTDLATASRLSKTTVDDLLGQMTVHAEPQIPGRIVLALLRRRFRDGHVNLPTAIKCARDITFGVPLTETESYAADRLDDSLSLAKNGTYGTLGDVRREVAEFLEEYAQFDAQIPTTA